MRANLGCDGCEIFFLVNRGYHNTGIGSKVFFEKAIG